MYRSALASSVDVVLAGGCGSAEPSALPGATVPRAPSSWFELQEERQLYSEGCRRRRNWRVDAWANVCRVIGANVD